MLSAGSRSKSRNVTITRADLEKARAVKLRPCIIGNRNPPKWLATNLAVEFDHHERDTAQRRLILDT